MAINAIGGKKRLFINLTPLILPHEILISWGSLYPPLLLKGEGEDIYRREASAPLLPSLPLPLIREGGQGDRLLDNPRKI
jgi:hypothetical protein